MYTDYQYACVEDAPSAAGGLVAASALQANAINRDKFAYSIEGPQLYSHSPYRRMASNYSLLKYRVPPVVA